MSAYSHWTTSPQVVTASSVTVTPSSSTFVNSSWVQLTAGISTSIVIVGIIPNPNVTSVLFRADLGTGGAGSETVIGTIGSWIESLDGSMFLEFKTPLYVGPNTRVAIRMRKTGTDTTNWFYRMVYYAYSSVVSGIANMVVTADFTAVGTVVHSAPHTAPSFSARTLQIRDPRRF